MNASQTDPLTYLDEVDARAEAATEGPWHGPHDEYGCVHFGDYGWVASGPTGQGPEYDVDSEQGKADSEFIAHTRQDLPALSKALRAVLAINTGDNRTLYGNDFEAGMAKALWLVHEAIQAALAVNDEGGKK